MKTKPLAALTQSKTDAVTSAAHTPGPWTDCLSTFNGLVEGFHIAARPHGSLSPICGSLPDTDMGNAEMRANARLIAAAPDLLKACRALQMEAATRGCGLRIADEAIAKAEGTEPSALSNTVKLASESAANSEDSQ